MSADEAAESEDSSTRIGLLGKLRSVANRAQAEIINAADTATQAILGDKQKSLVELERSNSRGDIFDTHPAEFAPGVIIEEGGTSHMNGAGIRSGDGFVVEGAAGGKPSLDHLPLSVIDESSAMRETSHDEVSTMGGSTMGYDSHTPLQSRDRTPGSSIDSTTFGEIAGGSAAMVTNGEGPSVSSSSKSILNMISTEKSPNKLEKPMLKQTVSAPIVADITIRLGMPHRTTASLENVHTTLPTNDSDDEDDDDGVSDIPSHISSHIVEKSPAERYIRFKEKLGSGAYKDVYRAYDTIEGIEVAWNVVKLSGVPKTERTRIVNEVRLLERLHHPNIISFHGSWVHRETERVIFVTEILSSGTLKSFVQKVQLIRWKIFRRWAIQILNGLEYLHSQDPPIIHRDLKCDNIFINGTSGDLRIGDFGLSTAISKRNQPLSVLGTPEFMAPELYDEIYNEKVDIYAFGMLLLEIITRDVPYHECTNPAQIYKKVTQGIPPPSLHRIKSIDARNFILLCLGIGEDANARPSASDLLKHQFLAKNTDDEMTIELEPAVEDMIVEEGDPTSMTFSDDSIGSGEPIRKLDGIDEMINNEYSIPNQVPIEPSERGMKNEISTILSKQVSDPLESRDFTTQPTANLEDEQMDDQYGEMPENESNMRKVTVLMGRGTELSRDDLPVKQEIDSPSRSATPLPTAIVKTHRTRDSDTSSLGGPLLYKVWAVPPAVIDACNKPYPNNVINLALTLPDVSQTTIEFTFDLVEDDPVQIAREMVTELDEVPDDAVLEISTAISAVAREARMKQNQWTQLQQQQQQNALVQQALHQQNQQHSQSMMALHSPGAASLQPQLPNVSQQPSLQASQTTVMPQHSGGSVVESQTASPGNDRSQTFVSGPMSAAVQLQLTQNHGPQLSPLPEPPSMLSPPSSQMSSLHMSSPQPKQLIPTTQPSVSVPSSPSTSSHLPQESLHTRSASAEAAVQQQPSTTTILSLPTSSPPGAAPLQPQPHLPGPTLPNASQDFVVTSQLAPQVVALGADASAKAMQQLSHDSSALQGGSHHSVPSDGSSAVFHQSSLPSDTSADVNDDDADDADIEEIRRLEQEFEKKLLRAKKSYHTRMDNLHRSKEEVEAQHQLLLEKHEKERIEFEKRVRLAEEEQTRRLNQIQSELLEKKKEVQRKRVKVPSTGVSAMQVQTQNTESDGKSNSGVMSSRPPLHGGHKRSSSHFDASMPQSSPLAADQPHRRNSSDGNATSESSNQVDSQQRNIQPPLS